MCTFKPAAIVLCCLHELFVHDLSYYLTECNGTNSAVDSITTEEPQTTPQDFTTTTQELITTQEPCEPPFEVHGEGCYMKVDTSLTWNSAQAHCQLQGTNVHLPGMETPQVFSNGQNSCIYMDFMDFRFA